MWIEQKSAFVPRIECTFKSVLPTNYKRVSIFDVDIIFADSAANIGNMDDTENKMHQLLFWTSLFGLRFAKPSFFETKGLDNPILKYDSSLSFQLGLYFTNRFSIDHRTSYFVGIRNTFNGQHAKNKWIEFNIGNFMTWKTNAKLKTKCCCLTLWWIYVMLYET